jgi:hypothetical protein
MKDTIWLVYKAIIVDNSQVLAIQSSHFIISICQESMLF